MAIRYVTFKRFTLDTGTPMIQFLGITTYKPCWGQVVPEDCIPVTPLIKDEVEDHGDDIHSIVVALLPDGRYAVYDQWRDITITKDIDYMKNWLKHKQG